MAAEYSTRIVCTCSPRSRVACDGGEDICKNYDVRIVLNKEIKEVIYDKIKLQLDEIKNETRHKEKEIASLVLEAKDISCDGFKYCIETSVHLPCVKTTPHGYWQDSSDFAYTITDGINTILRRSWEEIQMQISDPFADFKVLDPVVIALKLDEDPNIMIRKN